LSKDKHFQIWGFKCATGQSASPFGVNFAISLGITIGVIDASCRAQSNALLGQW
jgi:hypothetical protein